MASAKIKEFNAETAENAEKSLIKKTHNNLLIAHSAQRMANNKMKFTIADWFTVCRIIFSPFVLLLFLLGDNIGRMIAFVLFGLGAISDTIDGYIARRTKLSSFGKLWDPIADKLLTGFALVALSVLQMLPWWITAALIVRDIIITVVRIAKIKKTGAIILPVLPAKLKTTFEMIMIVALLLWAAVMNIELPAIANIIIQILGAVVVIMSWGTGIHYLIEAKKK